MQPRLADRTGLVVTLIKPEFTSDVGEAHRIHGAPVLGQFAQGVHAGFGEEGMRKARMTAHPDFDQPRCTMLWMVGGSFGWPACGPARQVRSKMPSAIDG